MLKYFCRSGRNTLVAQARAVGGQIYPFTIKNRMMGVGDSDYFYLQRFFFEQALLLAAYL